MNAAEELREEGRKEGKREVAKEMFLSNFDREQIVRLTGLSKEEIIKVKNAINKSRGNYPRDFYLIEYSITKK